MDLYRALVTLARRDHVEPSPLEPIADVALLVARRDAGRAGRDPHLHEVDLLGRRGVHLRLGDARVRRHALREAGIDLGLIALGVAVSEQSGDHRRDDLHVTMRVSPESLSGRHPVLIRDDEQPVLSVGWVVVRSEAEAVPAV
jgi:hypothetical protein